MAKKKEETPDITKSEEYSRLTAQPWFGRFRDACNDQGVDMIKRLESRIPRMWVLDAFYWNDTPQGFEWWSEVNAAWVRSFKA